MKDGSKIKETILLIAGILFISAGIACNEWTLASLFSSDGIIALSHRIIIWIVDISLIGIGLMLLIYRKSLTREKMVFIAGLLFILSGFFLNEWLLAILLTLEMNIINKIIVWFLDIYLICTGLILILRRKTIQLKNILLYTFCSLICFTAFLMADLYLPYSNLKHLKHSNLTASIYNVHVKDAFLGWQPKANNIGRHVLPGKFDVEYEIDRDDFKKISNTDNPDFSIYFLGDSYTFGYGVRNADTFPNIIKDKYLKKEVNVYNAGVMGYGIVQMYQRFLNIGPRIKKGDLVIFTPISNDITRNIHDFYFVYLMVFMDALPADYYPVFDGQGIKYHKVERSAFNRIKTLALSAPFTGNFWRAIHKKLTPDTTREAVEMIKLIKQKTEEKGGKFILIFLPDTNECKLGHYFVDISDFNYVDIMQYFPSQTTDVDKIKFSGDEHWNVNGHGIAAKAIVETLINNKIIDKKYLKEAK